MITTVLPGKVKEQMINENIAPQLIIGGTALMLSCRLGWRLFLKITSTTFDSSASVLPYVVTTSKILGVIKSEAFFLISQETEGPWKGKWSDFGGHCSEGENFYKAAARECEEESRGVLGDRKSLLKRVQKSPSIVYKKIYQYFPEERSIHHLFFLRLDSSFLKNRQLNDIRNLVHCDEKRKMYLDYEKGKAYWISTEQLLNAVKAGGNFKIADSIEVLRPSFLTLLESSKVQRVIEQVEMGSSCIPPRTFVDVHNNQFH